MVLDFIIIGYIHNNICQRNDLNAEVRQPHLFS